MRQELDDYDKQEYKRWEKELQILRYAHDDAMITAESVDVLQRLIKQFKEKATKYNKMISVKKKTKTSDINGTKKTNKTII